MNKALVTKTVVFVGMFQVSDFDKFFFIKNGIFNEQEILVQSIYTSDFSLIIIKGLNVLILPNQIVISETPLSNNRIKDIALKLGEFIRSNTTALGINFSWNLIVTSSLEDESKRLFFNENNKIYKSIFNTPKAVFGAYMSKEIENGRLKLDIKPQIQKHIITNETTNAINFSFNYHFDIANNDSKEVITSSINKHDTYLKESEEIISIYD